MLRIRLVEARDLPAADLSLFSQRTSDPYCTIAIGQQPGSFGFSVDFALVARATCPTRLPVGSEWRSKTIYKTLNPTWAKDEFAYFLVHNASQNVKIQMFAISRAATSSCIHLTRRACWCCWRRFDEDKTNADDLLGETTLTVEQMLQDDDGWCAFCRRRLPTIRHVQSGGSFVLTRLEL